jgi:hypothetical protein
MARRILWHTVMISVMGLLLVSCGEEGEIDPYKPVTLREVTRSQVVSKGFKYKLSNPNIEVLNQSLGLIREGSLVEFIGGRSLEEKLSGKMDGNFELAVVKEFSPYVHFKVERIYTSTDTTFMTPGSVVYPRVVDAAQFSADEYISKSLDGIPYNRTDVLRELENTRMALSGATITRETSEGQPYYVLHGKNVKFRVADTGDGVGLILKLLVQKGYPFEGGVLMTEVEDYGARMKTKVGGTVEVMYVRYGSRVILPS